MYFLDKDMTILLYSFYCSCAVLSRLLIAKIRMVVVTYLDTNNCDHGSYSSLFLGTTDNTASLCLQLLRRRFMV